MSEPSEPEYAYVKGQGWIPTQHETLSGIIGKWYVTLVKRKPEPGEYWFGDACPLEETFQNLKDGYPEFCGTCIDRDSGAFPIWNSHNRWVGGLTMLLKLVDSEQ